MSEPIEYGRPWWEVMNEIQAENARLKAEVERLKKFNQEAMAHIEKEERKSRERLEMEQEQVERLTKAGDAMVEALVFEDEPCKEIADWEAAKQGGQP